MANEFKVKNGVITPTVSNVANSDVAISASGTGKLKLNGLNWPATDGTANYVLTTNGTGTLSWAQQTGGSVNLASPGPIGGTTPSTAVFTDLTANGDVTLNGATISADTVLFTDENGVLTSSGIVNVVNGGTGKTTYTSALAAFTGYSGTLTGNTTTSLGNNSPYYQRFTGTSDQIVKLPAAASTWISFGYSYIIVNDSTGTLTVQTNNNTTVTTVAPNTSVLVTLASILSDAASSWSYRTTSTTVGSGGVGGAAMVSQDFTGTGSQTAFTLSTAPVNINYTMVSIDGVFQNRTSAYTVSGTTLTFTEAPASGAAIEVTTLISGALTGVASGGTTGQVLVKNSATDYDTTWATVSGGPTTGTGTVNFGSFPGNNEVSLAITGQSQITTNSKINVYVMAESTADHTANDHTYLPLFAQFTAGNIAAGTGFTIYGRSTEKLQGTFKVNWEWSN